MRSAKTVNWRVEGVLKKTGLFHVALRAQLCLHGETLFSQASAC